MFRATFVVGDINYLFRADWTGHELFDGKITEDFFNVEFIADTSRVSDKPVSSYGILDTGQQFTVFATVAVLLDNLIKSNDYPAFGFSAKERSRQRLYDTFAKKIEQHYKGQYRLDTFMEQEKYYLFYPEE